MVTRIESLREQIIPQDVVIEGVPEEVIENAIYILEDENSVITVENYFTPGDDFELPDTVVTNAVLHAKENVPDVRVEQVEMQQKKGLQVVTTVSAITDISSDLSPLVGSKLANQMGQISPETQKVAMFGVLWTKMEVIKRELKESEELVRHNVVALVEDLGKTSVVINQFGATKQKDSYRIRLAKPQR